MRMQRGRMAAAARREKTDTILRSTDRNTQHHGSRKFLAILMTYDDVSPCVSQIPEFSGIWCFFFLAIRRKPTALTHMNRTLPIIYATVGIPTLDSYIVVVAILRVQ